MLAEVDRGASVDDPPVVLLHGWGGSFDAIWRESGWRDRLAAQGRRVIEVDLPGHGRSAASPHPADYADLATSLRARLPQSLRFDAIGYSLGAKLALELCIREPQLCRRLVIAGLGANVFAAEKAAGVMAEALEHGVSAATPPTVAALVRYGLSAGNAALALAAVLRRPPNPVITPERLRAVRCPVLAVVGDQDAIALPLEPLLAAIPQAKAVVLPGVDHLALTSQPAFMDAALQFLK